NKDVGQGSMLITGSTPVSRVAIDLDFVMPFEAHNKVEFTLKPEGDGTHVNWAMSGPMPFISKVICLFVSMDDMVGKDFEAGLANLKAAAETA
ncbi:MAG: SRPBCC family protein, partial [Panacagrimonas sp.]